MAGQSRGQVMDKIRNHKHEMSQDTVDKKLKEWNETWFGDNQKIDVKKATDNIPDFLKKR